MFEWDPRKAAANAEKHDVTFDVAVTVFADAHAIDGQTWRTRPPKHGSCAWGVRRTSSVLEVRVRLLVDLVPNSRRWQRRAVIGLACLATSVIQDAWAVGFVGPRG